MSGGKGGSSTTEVTVPQYIEDAARRNLSRADDISKIGYTPYYGPDVAAFNPMQQSAFQNTANAASAFGMAGGGGTGMEGVPTPTTYAGGVQGYSSAPMYEQSLAELGRQRPGQKEFIDSFFIDPYTGQAGSRVGPTVDYTQPPADTGGNGGGGSNVGGNDGGGNPLMDETYARAKASRDSYVPTDMLNQKGGSYNPNPGYTGFGDRINGGGPGAAGETYQGGGVVSDFGNSLTTDVDLPGNVFSRALNVGDGKKDDGGNYSGKSNDGCVVATHAVNSGAFSPTTKREAVVWCMNVLHGKWWGEAIRRGYRYCGNKKIEQGKAREHYSEFRRYIDFANGKKRTVAGAITFTLRTAQFFAVGLIKKDA